MGCKQIDKLNMGPPSTKEHVENMDEVTPSKSQMKKKLKRHTQI